MGASKKQKTNSRTSGKGKPKAVNTSSKRNTSKKPTTSIKRKQPVAKTNKEKANTSSGLGKEAIGLLICTLGILMMLSMYFENSVGFFGELIKNALLGFFGIPAFGIPVLVLLYGILYIFIKDSESLARKAFLVLILIAIVSAIIHAGVYNKSDYAGANFVTHVRRFYRDASDLLQGGGVVGGLIAVPSILLLKPLGTVILLSVSGLIVSMLITEVSIAETIKELVLNIEENKQTFKETKKRRKKLDKVDAEMFKKRENIISFEEKTRHRNKKIDFIAIDNNKKNAEKNKKGTSELDFELHPALKNEMTDITDTNSIEELKAKPKSRNKKVKEVINKEEVFKEISIEATMRNSDNDNYTFPAFDLLDEANSQESCSRRIKQNALGNAQKLEETLLSFGIRAKVINVSVGPAVTRYELQPAPGIKVSRIVSLADDIALNLAAHGVRIEAPIPGKAAIGIEIPNKEMLPITLREIIETSDFIKFKSRLAFALGKDVAGDNVIIDIAKMPHVLVAGATGSGKSVCLNSLILSLLYKAAPNEVKLIMIDPKRVELGVYNGIPHLLIPVVVDPQKAAGALNWAVQEMAKRYDLFAEAGVRNLASYNGLMKKKDEENVLPQIVIIIDELAELMMIAAKEVEDSVCRLAQLARAAGMHLVIATQRPSVNVITGLIKANVPSRISFAVSSQIDSRTILDMAGAEKLMGKGDMLYFPVGYPKPVRVKGSFVSEEEVERVINFIKQQEEVHYDEDVIEEINENVPKTKIKSDDCDELLSEAIELAIETEQASVSFLQRKLKIGYARAGRIIDQMDQRGIISGYEGSKPRKLLISKLQWEEMKMNSDD